MQSISTLGLQLESGERLVKEFPSSSSLWDVLSHWDVNEKRLDIKALTKLESAVTKCTVGNSMFLLAYAQWSEMKLGHQCQSYPVKKHHVRFHKKSNPWPASYMCVLCH